MVSDKSKMSAFPVNVGLPIPTIVYVYLAVAVYDVLIDPLVQLYQGCRRCVEGLERVKLVHEESGPAREVGEVRMRVGGEFADVPKSLETMQGEL
ncbi:uncharacterized protein LTR77_002083 [Saxophila tyrrhenica]|uniref:Uncharacterized protein n=1 Tax=Saxophila tyrrhenica TaxID=1690608 RepID=A0AAV9PHZ3_9PEZI|nr:hypothetical protein LTR77_002083 [Saxophila tyrrhenica]